MRCGRVTAGRKSRMYCRVKERDLRFGDVLFTYDQDEMVGVSPYFLGGGYLQNSGVVSLL